MTNPVVHTLVFIAAVLIPGGLLVYFAWRAARKVTSPKANPNQNDDSDELGEFPAELPTVDEAREAFFSMYPKQSLRARSRRSRLDLFKTRRRKDSGD
jgi:hypothetical protein